MRMAAKVDRNHSEIVSALRKFGCSVLPIHQLKNCGDVIVAKNLKTCIVEIKDGNKPPSAKKLTVGEERFRDGWQGLYFVVENLADVIALVKWLEK